MPRTETNDPIPSLLSQYERALQIDKNALDDAWVEQPDVFYRVASQLALVTSRRDAAKMDRDNAIAELDKQLREEAVRTNTKTTEKALENEIATMPRVITLRKEYAGLCYEADRWEALARAFAQRADALKGLGRLYEVNYFAVETGRSERNDVANRQADEARKLGGQQRRERPIKRARV